MWCKSTVVYLNSGVSALGWRPDGNY